MQGQLIHLFSPYKGYKSCVSRSPFSDFLPVRNSESASLEPLWELVGWREKQDHHGLHDIGTKCKMLFILGHVSFSRKQVAASPFVQKKTIKIQFFRLLLKTPPNRYINYL